ncbi:hypothetical protein L1887_15414 [Cichorium endivia]|nr:hypothetical protein L1887_15414 [Cichorium endivia]
MASSSSSLSTSTYTSRPCKYHVFLSFRGKDTRNNFAGHLYSALKNKGIHTYMDDKTLARGDEIHPSLMEAIDKSQIAIVIFSENYAESKWCLNELEYIIKCKNTKGLIVMPIFYKVDLDDLKRQKRKYGEAFDNHKTVNKTKAELWRNALVDATRIAGWDSNVDVNKNESEFINKIVNEVSKRMHPLTPSANENLIGIGTRMQDFISKLQIGLGDVRMVGIWGVGGGGKTTLASSVYREISMEFDGCCIVENIREKSNKSGMESLQELILKNALKQNNVQVGSVVDGKQKICDGLSCIKVLIVLDDVDRIDQLKALAGSHKWFGDGSRIIITTRDQHVLNAHRVDLVHNISLLNDDEAINLFRKLSPQDYRPKKDYERLSEDVVSYAGGLPLALEILGHHLCDKDIDEWMSEVAQLKEIPNDDIVGKLKISYDGLTNGVKELFLDIACFFRWEKKDSVMEILDACGLHLVSGVKVLMHKALITISEDGTFDMHDLVQEMGHHIVRGKHPNNPETHSRVWKKEDILKICALDATTELDMIEAIYLERYTNPLPEHLPPIVANSKNLRWIKWKGDLSSPLLTNFPPRTLCYLSLSNSPQIQLWKGYKWLPNLKIIKLSYLDNLIMTPKFDGLPNLERFTISWCDCLEEIHPSIGGLERLVFLSIKFCVRLRMCPPITQLKKLRTLSLVGCNLGDEEIDCCVWDLPNLIELDLSQNEFSRLNFSRLLLPQLKGLDVSCCSELVELSELPSTIAVVTAYQCYSLESLGDISNCKWLWNVPLMYSGKNEVVGDILLDCMLQGNAIEGYFINIILTQQIPKRFVGRLFGGTTFTLRLPDDWYNDFCGFLICFVIDVTNILCPDFKIVIKQEVDEDSLFELCQESNKAVKSAYDYKINICIGYVSFASLGHTAFSNSLHTIISVSCNSMYLTSDQFSKVCVGVELIPRKSKGDEVQTPKVATDPSEFWNDGRQIFRIQDESKSPVEIIWRPDCVVGMK